MAKPLAAAAATALAVVMAPLQNVAAEHSKQRVVVCNGYADANVAWVGERPKGWRPLLGEAAMAAADRARGEGASRAEPSSSSSAWTSGLGGFLQQPARDGQLETVGALAATSRHSPMPAVATSMAGASATSKRTAPTGAASDWSPHSHGAVRSYIRRLRQSAAFLRPSGGALWTRSLAYGACEEYFVDLSSRSLFFLAPDGLTECAFDTAEAIEDEEVDATVSGAMEPAAPPSLLVAVITKPWAKSEACAARAVAVPSEEASKEEEEALRGAKQAARPSAEVVTIDAFTPSHASAAALTAGIGSLFEDAAHNRTVNASDVSRALVGVGGASLRLEDVVEDSSITSEVIASQSLDFGGSSRVEARSYHVVLEDLRGVSMLDHRQIELEAGDVLVAARVGRGDDAKGFPERLLLYRSRASES